VRAPPGHDCALAEKAELHYFPIMQAHRVETTLSEDGVITLRDTPFRSGETVEIIVLSFSGSFRGGARFPLRGKPVTLIDPTAPVADVEWESVG